MQRVAAPRAQVEALGVVKVVDLVWTGQTKGGQSNQNVAGGHHAIEIEVLVTTISLASKCGQHHEDIDSSAQSIFVEVPRTRRLIFVADAILIGVIYATPQAVHSGYAIQYRVGIQVLWSCATAIVKGGSGVVIAVVLVGAAGATRELT